MAGVWAASLGVSVQFNLRAVQLAAHLSRRGAGMWEQWLWDEVAQLALGVKVSQSCCIRVVLCCIVCVRVISRGVLGWHACVLGGAGSFGAPAACPCLPTAD